MSERDETRTTAERLRGKTIAILSTDGVEQIELEKPRQAFEAQGATTVLIAPNRKIQAFNHQDRGHLFEIDRALAEADPDDFDGLFLPGGAIASDTLRLVPEAVLFVRAFAHSGLPVAAICHAPWLLIEADVVRNRTVTSWPSLRTDLENAGARWVDEEVVVDSGLVTSRKPDDIDAFAEAAIAEFALAERKALPKRRWHRKRAQKRVGAF